MLSREFSVGNTVQFGDAVTGELKYGRIERRYGSDVILRIISHQEAEPYPKVLKTRLPCQAVRTMRSKTGLFPLVVG